MIDGIYQAQMREAVKIKGDHWAGEGFASPGEQQQAVNQYTGYAKALRAASETRLAREEQGKVFGDENRLKALQMQENGDLTGAKRQELQNELFAEASARDPNDWEAGQRFGKIYNQTLSNFDADAKRQKTREAAESQDKILGYQEEGSEAKLRGEGKDWEANVSALKFYTEQRVRTLREAADAEADVTHKQQLNREADAADQAGKLELQAQQQEHQRQLVQSADGQDQQDQSQTGKTEYRGPIDDELVMRMDSHATDRRKDASHRRRPSTDDPDNLAQSQATYFSDAASIRQAYEMRNIQAARMAAVPTGDDGDLTSRIDQLLAGRQPKDSDKLVELISKIDKHFSRGLTLAMVKD